MVENLLGELLNRGVGEILSKPFGIQTDLVHTDQADGREVVVERTEIALGVGVKAGVQEFGNDRSLRFERACGDVHQIIEAGIEILLIGSEVSDAGEVDCDNADGACRFTGTEESAGFFAEFAKVEAETAAHRADVARFHV